MTEPSQAPPPGAVPQDPDISGAVTAMDLQKIKAQDYRNETQYKAKVADDLAAKTLAQYQDLGKQEAEQFKRELMLVAFDKYMTTSTAVDPAAVLKDAVNDAARAKAGYDEFCKAFGL